MQHSHPRRISARTSQSAHTSARQPLPRASSTLFVLLLLFAFDRITPNMGGGNEGPPLVVAAETTPAPPNGGVLASAATAPPNASAGGGFAGRVGGTTMSWRFQITLLLPTNPAPLSDTLPLLACRT